LKRLQAAPTRLVTGAGLLAASLFLSAAAVPPRAHDWTASSGAMPSGPAGLAALSERFPESAALLRRVIAASLEPGQEARLRVALDRLAAMGYALSPASIAAVAAYLPAAEGQALAARFNANRAVFGDSHLAFTIPAERRLIEGIAWDAAGRRLFAASVVGRELLVHDARGWRTVPGVDAGSLFGVAIDPRRRLLWLTSGVVEQTPSPATAFRGLVALDLGSLRVVRRVTAPAGGSPGDLAIAADGTVFASDPQSGALYRARPGAPALELLAPAGAMRSPQGLALSPDGRRLYVADYGYGIAIVDLATGRLARLAARGIAMLDGIDGLIPDGNTLIAIQNGVNPRRIVRLHLAAGGGEIARVEMLERANPDWGEPTLGTLRDGQLLYVADAQWERFGAGGIMTGEGPLRPATIRILGLRGSGRPPARPE
jgi:sugar lactone lactonase YvrE